MHERDTNASVYRADFEEATPLVVVVVMIYHVRLLLLSFFFFFFCFLVFN
jgi:hypothetical protein